ncbi:MAG: hypothetical protein NTY38_22180, partial [Acidobacteria bacterium]|nr:hypothetical protein [Acidobacteriota bacterium]
MRQPAIAGFPTALIFAIVLLGLIAIPANGQPLVIQQPVLASGISLEGQFFTAPLQATGGTPP